MNLSRVKFDELWVWGDQGLSRRLDWYRQVAVNQMPAKSLLARRVPLSIPLEAPTEALWDEFHRLLPHFLSLHQSVRAGGTMGPALEPNLLDLVSALGSRMLTSCNFCRWNCRVDRSGDGKLGACQLATETRVASAFHHHGEELIYRGRGGSGTIFFTSCNMRCAFCQNGDISTDKHNGTVIGPDQLAALARRLRLEGCHNINWVGGDPTIHLHTILEAIRLLAGQAEPEDSLELRIRSDFFVPYRQQHENAYYQGEFNVPMLWNSNFFMTEQAMDLLRVVTDVWLPDFKFGPGDCPLKLARTPWYWETVTSNLLRLEEWQEDYTIRHLVMPNHVECCTYGVFEWLAEYAPTAPINIMAQYHPDNYCDPTSAKYQEKYAAINRRCSPDELIASYRRAEELGLVFRTLTHERRLQI
ncbi:MAG: radical SAM protein [Vulcanimicrobiota bacterium]